MHVRFDVETRFSGFGRMNKYFAKFQQQQKLHLQQNSVFVLCRIFADSLLNQSIKF